MTCQRACVQGVTFATLAACYIGPSARRPAQESGRPAVQVWVTTGDQSKLLSRQADVSFSYGVPSPIPTIDVDEGGSYEQMIGFGTLPAASVVTFNWN